MEVMTFADFLTSQKVDPQRALTEDLTNSLEIAKNYMFFANGNAHIYRYENSRSYGVTIGNVEKEFEDITEAALFLYKEWYLSDIVGLYYSTNYLQLKDFTITNTGGNCTALRKDLSHDHYVLLTHKDEACAPVKGTNKVTFSFYDGLDESIFIFENIPVKDIYGDIDTMLDLCDRYILTSV